MRSLWFDDFTTPDSAFYGCFTAPPEVIAASIPRPITPFVPISHRMNQPFLQDVFIQPSTPSSSVLPRISTPQPSHIKTHHSKNNEVNLSS